MRGRKPKWESRALEFYGRLARWKQTPGSSRPSLRALARQIGTSHQLLGHYLQRWEKWQAKELRREAKEICALAETETRSWVRDEMLKQVTAYERAAFQCSLSAALDSCIRQLKRQAKRGQLSRRQVKVLRALARKGHPGAQEILEKWLFLAQESENNLPLSKRHASKSFGCVEGVAGNSSKMLPRVRIEIIGGDHAK